eukprot:1518826-Prymnesium_polylepis.2
MLCLYVIEAMCKAETLEDDPVPVPTTEGAGTSIEGRCDHCGQRALKKCAGCGTVVFCNKECQTRAWPRHKKLCRQHSRQHKAGQKEN